jgi:DinB superfamily
MDINTVNQNLINTLRSYQGSLDSYNNEQFNFKKADEIWSLGQMYEHLVLSAQFFFLKNIKYCLEQRNGQLGGDKNASGKNVFKYNSFPPIKVKVPGNAPEPIAQTQDIYKEILDKIIQQLESQIDVVANDSGEYKTIHPVFSWHNAKEWLQSFEMHHRHHLRQKAELEGYLS